MYAGGLSYLSSGTFRGASRVGASVWPEALASASSKGRQMKKPIPETPKDIRSNKARLFLVWLIIGYCWWKSEWSGPLEGRFFSQVRRSMSILFLIFLIFDRGFETRSFPNSLAATLRGFTFYLAVPINSIRGRHGLGK